MTSIVKLKSKALSNSDILKLTDDKCNVMSYDELQKFKTLDDALGSHNALVVLYEFKENFGHWCCVIKQSDKLIEFFDPYSSKPDREFSFLPEQYKLFPYLSKLMYESPYKLSYNEHKFQKNGGNINTCGRWCATRIILKSLPLDKFAKIFLNRSKSPDDLVTYFTSGLKGI
jgi:hypothetical protein